MQKCIGIDFLEATPHLYMIVSTCSSGCLKMEIDFSVGGVSFFELRFQCSSACLDMDIAVFCGGCLFSSYIFTPIFVIALKLLYVPEAVFVNVHHNKSAKN